MRRRTLLGALGTAIVGATSGCSTLDRTEASLSLDFVAAGLSVDAAGVLRLDGETVSGFDARSPARVRLTVHNRSDRELELRYGPVPPFSTSSGQHVRRPASLALVPEPRPSKDGSKATLPSADRFVPTERGDCWRATAAPRYETDRRALVTLTPGESYTRTYLVLGHPTNEGCLPAGSYVFRTVEPLGFDPDGDGSVSRFELAVTTL
jgi:hypothetical protein